MNFFSLFKRQILYKLRRKINIDSDGFDNKKSLDELFYYYGSDKANIFKKSKDNGHGFSKFYKKNLDRFKDKEIKILEVGSYSGSSAAAFSKYFINSKVYCFDINVSKFLYASKNIHVYSLNINNEKILKKKLNEIVQNSNTNFFDIIIDDGSHFLSDILITLKNLFKYVKNDGIYVIEDFKHPNYYEYNRNIDHILVDEMLKNLKDKRLFKSNIIKKEDQIYLHENIKDIKLYKGNLKDSDICFLKKR